MAQLQMPLNLSLVLDKSGSMQGKKMQNLREAAKRVVDRLAPQDTISIVAFSDRKYLIAANQPVTDKDALKKKIGRIRDGGGTAISGGMAQGLAELEKTRGPDRVSRMLLLTDGQTFGDEKACRKLGKQAGDRGIVVNALGLGDDWNEDLLDAIAEGSGGVADFIDSPDKIELVFERAVQSMQDTVVQNAQMVLRLASSVTPRHVWQVLPMISNLGYRPLSDRDVQVTLGELEKGQPRSLLVEMLIGARPAGRYRIAQAEISYDVPGLHLVGQKVKADILLDLTADASLAKQYDPEVMNIVEKVTAFKLQTRALEEAKMGNVAGASQKLRAAGRTWRRVARCHRMAPRSFATRRAS
jgi:Ca-activated chloride channel family protein